MVRVIKLGKVGSVFWTIALIVFIILTIRSCSTPDSNDDYRVQGDGAVSDPLSDVEDVLQELEIKIDSSLGEAEGAQATFIKVCLRECDRLFGTETREEKCMDMCFSKMECVQDGSATE